MPLVEGCHVYIYVKVTLCEETQRMDSAALCVPPPEHSGCVT